MLVSLGLWQSLSAVVNERLLAFMLWMVLAVAGVSMAWKPMRARIRCRHVLTSSTLVLRSFGSTRDIPIAEIAGVGLVKGEARSNLYTYESWSPIVWTVDGPGYVLRGERVMAWGRSNEKLLATRPGKMVIDLYTQIMRVQGNGGPLAHYRHQADSTTLPSFIELLPGSEVNNPHIGRWNPGSGWQHEVQD